MAALPRARTLQGSLVVRFVAAGLVPLVVASALLFWQQRSSAQDQADQVAAARAQAVATDLEREFASWRTQLLVGADNPVLRQWYAPGQDRAALRPEVDRLLLLLNALNPDLIDESCFIAADGPELARQTSGTTAPVADLSADESGADFFAATMALDVGQVHQNSPYVSEDSEQWVISNSTPLAVGGRKVALLHFETNLDAVRRHLAQAAGDGVDLRVVDTTTGLTIGDSRWSDPLVTQDLAPASATPLPGGWSRAAADVGVETGNDNHWRVEAAVEPAGALGAALLTKLAGLALLVGAALVVLARRSATSVVTPLRLVAGVTSAIAGGDRSVRAAAHPLRELDQVAGAVNSMLDGLVEQEAELVRAQQDRETHLEEVAGQRAAAEQQVRIRAQDVVDETASSVSADLREIRAQADVVRQGAGTIEERVGETDQVTRTVGEQAEHAHRTVADLRASLHEVDGMTRLIAGVADQTKLLALNATIEAARAGEAGRGFSVVADEVRELAMETARSTDQISRTITALHGHSTAVADAIGAMGQGIVEVSSAAGVLHGIAQEQFAVVDSLNTHVDETLARVEGMAGLTDRLERRRSRRVPLSAPGELTLGGTVAAGVVVDLSSGGLRFRSDVPLTARPGATGSVGFELDGRRVAVRVVTRSLDADGRTAGVEFEGVGPDTAATLRDLLAP